MMQYNIRHFVKKKFNLKLNAFIIVAQLGKYDYNLNILSVSLHGSESRDENIQT